MSKRQEETNAERQRLRSQYAGLYEATLALLYRHDPVGINFEINPDEYEPEVGTILPRLQSCESPKDVQRVVYAEFQRWFANSAGQYDDMKALPQNFGSCGGSSSTRISCC